MKVKTPEECKAAEPRVLEAAKFILASPLESNDKHLYEARILIIDWMSNTPEHSFSLDDNISKLSKGKNSSLIGIFMAAQTKFVLENPDSAKDSKKLQIAAFSAVAEYCMNEANGVEKSKSVTKLIEAYKSGKMDGYAGK